MTDADRLRLFDADAAALQAMHAQGRRAGDVLNDHDHLHERRWSPPDGDRLDQEWAVRLSGILPDAIARKSFGFRCDSDLAQLAALRAGVGIGGAQEAIARRTPELVRLLPQLFSHPLEIWLAVHEDVATTPRVRNMLDWLGEGLAKFVKRRSS